MSNFVFVKFDEVTTTDLCATNRIFRSNHDSITVSDSVHVFWRGYTFTLAEKIPTRMRTVRAVLTHEARRFLSYAIYTGATVRPVSFVLGTGWNEQRWNTLPAPSGASTQVVNPIFTGTAVANQLQLEEANASTLCVRISTYNEFASQANEVLLYAKIHRDPYYKGLVIPFASCRFPTWHHAPAVGSSSKQYFVTRILIPLGMGIRVDENTAFKQQYTADTVTATDSLTRIVGHVRAHADALTAVETTSAV